MSNLVKEVSFEWRFDSCGDPNFKVDEQGLEVEFTVYLGAENKAIEIRSLLKKYGLEADPKIPDLDDVYDSIFFHLNKNGMEKEIVLLDSIYNHAGSALACFKFNFYDYVFYSSEETIMKKYIDFTPINRNSRGLYEKINLQGEREYYIFLGHDNSLVIKTSKEYSLLEIKKLSEINGL